jgi:hypothetical protein
VFFIFLLYFWEVHLKQNNYSAENLSSRRFKVDIRKLKAFAFSEIQQHWVLREVILAENDEVDIPTFLARLGIWLQLSKIKNGAHK